MASGNDHQIKKVAVIGAGAAGIATVKLYTLPKTSRLLSDCPANRYLEAENYFSTIDIFEQRGHIGGLWKHTPETSGDGLFRVPQTDPHVSLERPVPRISSNGEQ